MTVVTSWYVLAAEVACHFPEVAREAVLAREGDMAALMRLIAEAHDLTFAEAAEVVTFRLPHFLEAERLSA
ncbi:MAG: hypothetical protein ACU0GG_13400 [Paracoccaceae bacterium]